MKGHFTKAVVILKALQMGIPCEIGNRTYCMDLDGELVCPAQNLTTGEMVHLKVNFGVTLSEFIYLRESANDYELDVIRANTGLNSL